jgi:ABC transport system ATP-binding/permease protein
MPILTLEAIGKQFADRPLLDGVSLTIDSGERVGVVGVNGSGKTTLLRIAAGVEPPDDGRVAATRGLRLAYLPQNPVLDPDLTVIEQVFRGETPEIRLVREYEQAAAALARHPADADLQQSVAELIERMDAAGSWSLEREAKTILTRLGIAELGARVGDLSGGQRKRVAMAATMILPADLLILDEPTNHIDIDTVAWLEDFLSRTTAALLLVTHDRYFLDRVVGRIVEIERAKLYSYPGSYSRFLELKAERAAQQAVGEARRQTILKKELAWLARGAQARTTKQQARIDRITAMQADILDAAQSELEISVASRRLGKRVIELQGIGKRFPAPGAGERTLIRDLDLSVGPRDRIGIIGPNGSGKTTLLNIIAGRIPPDAGAVVVGETVHMAYYDQESAELDESQRAIDYVKEGAELIRTGAGDTATAAQMLERFLFPAAAHYTPIAKLSGGERRRLYLLRKLIVAPNVLLLDEPTNDLDIQTLAVLEDYLDDFGGAIVVVSHDRYFLDRTVGRLLAFEGDGLVNDYPGGYSAYAQRRASAAGTPDTASKTSRTAPLGKPQPSSPASSKPRKLTFKETRELQELESRIAALEAEQASIEARMAAPSEDYHALAALSADLGRVSQALERAFDRWAELAELAEGS